MFINPSLVFQLFIYFILPLAINIKEMLPNYLLIVCSCCLCSLVAFRCICGFRGVTQIYRVKCDGPKKSSHLNIIIEKPITVLKNLASDGKEAGKVRDDILDAKSEQKKVKNAQNQGRIATVKNRNKAEMLTQFMEVAKKEVTEA